MTKVKIPCKNCSGLTNHEVLESVDKNENTEDAYYWSQYQIVRCLGCESISFRQAHSNSMDLDDEGQPMVDEAVFPPRLALRKHLKDFWRLPKRVREVYLEVYRALEVKAEVLAGIGIRAVVESVCHEKSASGRTLKDKIDDLHTQGILTQQQAEFLHGARFLGNRAAHESEKPEEDELEIVLDILDNLLMNTYVLPKKFKDISET